MAPYDGPMYTFAPGLDGVVPAAELQEMVAEPIEVAPFKYIVTGLVPEFVTVATKSWTRARATRQVVTNQGPGDGVQHPVAQ